MRTLTVLTALVLFFRTPVPAAGSLSCDLTQYKALPGLTATVANGAFGMSRLLSD